MPYTGKWDLVYFTKNNQSEEYVPGEIIWEFNKYDELIVTINTTLPGSSQLPIKSEGIYYFIGSDYAININNYQYAAEVIQDTLLLTHNPDTGGSLLKFIRVEE